MRRDSYVGRNLLIRDWDVHYRDLSEALAFFKLGAEQRQAGCMGALAFAYHCGEGTARDDAKALGWARAGAASDPQANLVLADLVA